jgi:hypothetical protein
MDKNQLNKILSQTKDLERNERTDGHVKYPSIWYG